jgi:hypothetical protein
MTKYDINMTKYDINMIKYDINITKYDINMTKYDINMTKYDINITKYDINITIFLVIFISYLNFLATSPVPGDYTETDKEYVGNVPVVSIRSDQSTIPQLPHIPGEQYRLPPLDKTFLTIYILILFYRG